MVIVVLMVAVVAIVGVLVFSTTSMFRRCHERGVSELKVYPFGLGNAHSALGIWSRGHLGFCLGFRVLHVCLWGFGCLFTFDRLQFLMGPGPPDSWDESAVSVLAFVRSC